MDEPSAETLAERAEFARDAQREDESILADQEACPDCDGAGYTVIPAHQSGGEIIDEKEVVCLCKTKDL